MCVVSEALTSAASCTHHLHLLTHSTRVSGHSALDVMSHLTPPAEVPKTFCFCQPLHQYCDPASCSEASGITLQPKNLLLPWIQLVDAAKAGCHTCQILRQCVEMFEEWPSCPSMNDELLGAFRVAVETNRAVGCPVLLTAFQLHGRWGNSFEIRQILPSGKFL